MTGSGGMPVKGLTKKDFEVLDDGTPQKILSFLVHTSSPTPALALPKLPPLPAGLLTNYSPVPADAPLNVILLDLENTPLESMDHVRSQVGDFLRKQPLDAPFAVFVMGPGAVSMLQGFTTVRSQLLSAVNSAGAYSFYFQPGLDPFALYASLAPASTSPVPGVPNPSASLPPGRSIPQNQPAPQVPEVPEEPLGQAQDALREAQMQLLGMPPEEKSYLLRGQARDTANDMAEMATILSGLPGRKNLLWFTGSLPLNLDNLLKTSQALQAGDTGPSIGGLPKQLAIQGLITMHNDPLIVQAAVLLERSHTAVFAIDALGLEVGGANPGWIKEKLAEHSTLDVVADITGGHAFYNTNGFKQAMATSTNEGENYYTLSYVPASAAFRGELRHIHVKLLGRAKRYRPAYRRSYYANASDAAPDQAAHPALAFALQHGAPAAQQILFWVSLQKVGKPRAAGPGEPGSPAASVPAGKATSREKAARTGPEMLQTYVIHYLLVAKMLAMTGAQEGKRQVKLELAARAFAKNGAPLVTILNTFPITLTPKTYQQVENNGLHLNQTVAVPARTAFLRLAVRDNLSSHLGSLEVPLASASSPRVETK